MNAWGKHREVEKVKPFAERAAKCIDRLREKRLAILTLEGPFTASPIVTTLLDAAELLKEAATRGVKGKDQ